MTIEKFTISLNEFDRHLIAMLHSFEEDTGIKVGFVMVQINEDGDYEVSTGLDFPEPKESA